MAAATRFEDGADAYAPLVRFVEELPAEHPAPGLLSRILNETTIGGMLKDAGNAVTLPGDVYAGRVDPMSDEGIKRSFDLAGLLTMGSGAAPAGKNELRAGVKLRSGAETPETDLAWYFRDVKRKPSLTPAENRRFSGGATTYDSVTVPVRSLNATQATVNPDFAVTNSSAGELPYVFRKDGQLYVSDGHHRITKAVHEGADNVRVRLLDLDGKDTSTPLLDWKPRSKSKGDMSDDELLRLLFGGE